MNAYPLKKGKKKTVKFLKKKKKPGKMFQNLFLTA